MLRRLALALLLLSAPQVVRAAPAPAPVMAAPDSSRAHAPALRSLIVPTTAPVIVGSDTIVVLRATVAGTSAPERVELIHDRIGQLSVLDMTQPVHVEPVDQGSAILVGDQFLFGVVSEDVEPGSTLSTAQVAQAAALRLTAALRERARMLSPSYRARAALYVVVATFLLVLALRVLGWFRRRVIDWVESKAQAHRGKLKLGDVDFLSQFRLAVSWIARVVTQLGGLALIVVWLIFAMNRFPETQHWGLAARTSVLGILRDFQLGILRSIPGLVAVALIILVARFVTQVVADIFTGIERGTIHIPAIHPETARATRRLLTVFIWLFAIVVAYPLLPGSGSDAFKGLSVFLGLIVTLGSSGVVGHVMSGIVLVYSRALRPGDFVKIGDIEGKVIEVGTLSVKVANIRKEEFTIPNAVIVGTTVKNYSRLAREEGASLTTSVSVGYDAPWRVVYELLTEAAVRTPGVRKDPAPVVFQPSLSTFSVEYQLVVILEDTAHRVKTLTLLHQNIQDAFNERGVQIMTPAFESQPERRVVIPKDQWTHAPLDPKA